MKKLHTHDAPMVQLFEVMLFRTASSHTEKIVKHILLSNSFLVGTSMFHIFFIYREALKVEHQKTQPKKNR